LKACTSFEKWKVPYIIFFGKIPRCQQTAGGAVLGCHRETEITLRWTPLDSFLLGLVSMHLNYPLQSARNRAVFRWWMHRFTRLPKATSKKSTLILYLLLVWAHADCLCQQHVKARFFFWPGVPWWHFSLGFQNCRGCAHTVSREKNTTATLNPQIIEWQDSNVIIGMLTERHDWNG
jgi:hypothetical protein